jgi:hypothetical protein
VRPAEEAVNEDVERFLEECRIDPFFQNNPNGVDRIEDLLTRFYHEADESPAWQELWDRMRGIITRKAPLIERFEELLLLLKKTFG